MEGVKVEEGGLPREDIVAWRRAEGRSLKDADKTPHSHLAGILFFSHSDSILLSIAAWLCSDTMIPDSYSPSGVQCLSQDSLWFLPWELELLKKRVKVMFFSSIFLQGNFS